MKLNDGPKSSQGERIKNVNGYQSTPLRLQIYPKFTLYTFRYKDIKYNLLIYEITTPLQKSKDYCKIDVVII